MSRKKFKKTTFFREPLNTDSFYKFLLEDYGMDEPIFIEDINIVGYSKQWLYKQLKILVDNGNISKFSRGIYYIPSMGILGKRLLNPLKIINKKYINDGSQIGMFVGTSLLNEAHLSTQVPQTLTVLTNNEKAKVRKVRIGNQEVVLRQSLIKIDDENCRTIKLLELINETERIDLNSDKKKELCKFARESGISKQQIISYISHYPKRVMDSLIKNGVWDELI